LWLAAHATCVDLRYCGLGYCGLGVADGIGSLVFV
jgi:hypothetical protein